MGKSKEFDEDLRKRMVDLHKSGMSLGAISKKLQIPRSSVQTTVRKYKLLGDVVTLPRSGRKPKLSPSAERKVVRMVRNNPGTTNAQLCHELRAAGTCVSVSTVKRVLHRHGLKGCRARKTPQLRVRLRFAPEHSDKTRTNDTGTDGPPAPPREEEEEEDEDATPLLKHSGVAVCE